jgi:hypothetical protein
MTSYSPVYFNAPITLVGDPTPSVSSGFSVDAQGTGSFTGLDYTVPAHASGEIKADIAVMTLTSQNVADLNALILGMLSASQKTSFQEQEQTSASADLSIFSFFGGGGASASYSDTKTTMNSSGLSDANITTIVNAMAADATAMTHVTLDFFIDNSQSDFSVDGELDLYTISGKINAGQGDVQYRMLANKGSAGQGGGPAKGAVIPLS